MSSLSRAVEIAQDAIRDVYEDDATPEARAEALIELGVYADERAADCRRQMRAEKEEQRNV